MLLKIMENRSVLSLGTLQRSNVIFTLCIYLVFDGNTVAGFERR